MKLFGPIYERMMLWAAHKRAPAILTVLSFFEAFVFPVPPEVMLAPMTLAKPKMGLRYASLSLGAAMLGGLVGYAIGHYAMHILMPLFERFGYAASFEEVRRMMVQHGFWVLLIGGFTPVPFKILTIASGAVGVPIWEFLAGALIGRGKRVYIVAGAIMLGGARAEQAIRRHVEWLGWLAIALLIGVFVWLRYWHAPA